MFNKTLKLEVAYHIKGFDLQNKKILIWNGQNIDIHELSVEKSKINSMNINIIDELKC